MRTDLGSDDVADRPPPTGRRRLITRAFNWTEDLVYLGLSILLALSAFWLLGRAASSFFSELMQGDLAIISLLDQLLLVLMIVELMYTVQVSAREHVLAPEPFLLVGLVATIRRILVLTAEFANLATKGESAIRVAMLELVLLTVMVLALVASLRMLAGRRAPPMISKG